MFRLLDRRIQSAVNAGPLQIPSFVDHFLNQYWYLSGSGIANLISRPNPRGGLFAPLRFIAKYRADRIPASKFVADLDVAEKSNPGIDLVFDADTTTAGLGNGMTDLLSINCDYKT